MLRNVQGKLSLQKELDPPVILISQILSSTVRYKVVTCSRRGLKGERGAYDWKVGPTDTFLVVSGCCVSL